MFHKTFIQFFFSYLMEKLFFFNENNLMFRYKFGNPAKFDFRNFFNIPQPVNLWGNKTLIPHSNFVDMCCKNCKYRNLITVTSFLYNPKTYIINSFY